MTKEYILKKISKSFDYDLSEDFVAAAIKIENDEAVHAGIAICMDEDLYIFHYAGAKIELELMDKDKWYIENKLSFIDSEEVIAFFVYCENIKNHADPSYGFNYNGSYFLEDGSYFSEVEDYQFMTCVGFCLAVLTGAIESKKYLEHEDWEMADHEKDYYFMQHIESLLDSVDPAVKNRIKKNLRRIFPIDYFTATLITNLPVRKVEIDKIKDLVIECISEK